MESNPPKNLQDLRNLASQIEMGTSEISLGSATLATLKNMLAAPATTAISTTPTIAKANNVNPSTLTRLSYALGYTKFAQLQRVFRDHVEQNAQFYTTRVNRLINSPRTHPNSLFNAIVTQESANIASLAEDMDEKTLEKTVSLLIGARKIRFHGRRQFFSLAAFYSYSLGLIREGVDVLQEDVHGISHSLTFMNDADLLVVMGCAPYTKATVDACRIAQKRQIGIIAITDSPNSPLTEYAQHFLIIPIESDYYSNSMAASFAMAEALLAMTAQKMGQSAVNNLKKREQLIEEFGISINHANQ